MESSWGVFRGDGRNGDQVKLPSRRKANSQHPLASGTTQGAGSHNGNGNGKIPSLSEGRIDFIMPSFEATMTLPAEKPVDVADTVVGKADREQK